MKLRDTSIAILSDLRSILIQLSDEEFKLPLAIFSEASVGQHTRHILEFFQCLIQSYSTDIICYDDRTRSLDLESNVTFAIEKLDQICQDLDEIRSDKTLNLAGQLSETRFSVQSSMMREMIYVVEHTVHHLAVIKIGLVVNFPEINIPDNFGVADSTQRFKNSKCAR